MITNCQLKVWNFEIEYKFQISLILFLLHHFISAFYNIAMPCLIIAGHPSAGKTTLANLLKERALLHDAIDEVVVLNEESECGCIHNDDDGNEQQGETSSIEKNYMAATTKQELYETSEAEKKNSRSFESRFWSSREEKWWQQQQQ